MLFIRRESDNGVRVTAVVSISDDNEFILGFRYNKNLTTRRLAKRYSRGTDITLVDVEGLYKDGTKTIAEVRGSLPNPKGGFSTPLARIRLPDSVTEIREAFDDAKLSPPPIRRSMTAVAAGKVKAALHAVMG